MLRCLLILTVLAVPARAQEAGEAVFMDHCATCHGPTARGDGPMAALLSVAPPDLTGLAARNGGEFPAERVAETIDGRLQLRAHGGPMPVFGPVFEGESDVLVAPDGTEITGDARLLSIVRWLASIQK